MTDWKPHSYEKVSLIGDYLRGFAVAAASAPNRVYVDLFAGDTVNKLTTTGEEFEGSAMAALGAQPPFTHLALFEKDRAKAARLEQLGAAHPSRVDVYPEDCNTELPRVLSRYNPRAPTFALLDPYGLQIDWSTIERIADHKRLAARTKVEMVLLFPTNSIPRVLGAGNLARVARLYGAGGPWERVLAARYAGELDPGVAQLAYLLLYMDRLEALDYAHMMVRHIRTRYGVLYSLVFVTDHPAGRRIWTTVAEAPRMRPAMTLFDLPEERPPVEDIHTGWRDRFPIELPPWSDE